MESLPDEIYNHILHFIPLGTNPTAALMQLEIDKCNTDDDIHIYDNDSDEDIDEIVHAQICDEDNLNDWMHHYSLNILYASRNDTFYFIKNRMDKLNCRDKHPELYWSRYAN